MSDYRIVSPPNIVPGPVTQTFSAIPSGVAIGMEVLAIDKAAGTAAGGAAGIFEFCRGSNVASVGQFVQIQNGSAVLLASANAQSNFPIGVCPSVLSATNVYGWVQVKGRVDYATHTNTGVTAGVPQYIGATAGQVVSNAVSGQRIFGLVVPANQTVTATSVSYSYDLYRPFIPGTFNSATATNATNGY